MEIIKIPKKEGIIDRTTGRVLNRKLRVAAYARVSTMGAEDKKSISDGLKKVKELLDSKDIMEDFDQEIFNAIVDYVIVGGYDENGKLNKVLRNGLRIRVECENLYKKFNEYSAFMLFPMAIMYFKKGDYKKSKKFLKDVQEVNPYIIKILKNDIAMIGNSEDIEYYAHGSKEEASIIVAVLELKESIEK